MITPHFQGGAAALAIRPPRRITRLLTLLLLFASLATVAPATTASAEPSGTCSNGAGNETQLVSGNFGLPLWLGIQYVYGTTPRVNLITCYGTAAPDEAKLVGGYNYTRVSANGVTTSNVSDSNSGVQPNLSLAVAALPTYSVSPGGASGGQAITFEIPFSVCSGACYTAPGGGLATTGLILGTLTQKSAPGGVSAAYEVSKLCLMVNGIPVTSCSTGVSLPGATTTGNLPANVGTGGATPGPCVVGVCIPSIDYVGTSGRQLATIYLPELGAIPVYGVRACAYQRDAQTPCPA